jgi:hypothetical protein
LVFVNEPMEHQGEEWKLSGVPCRSGALSRRYLAQGLRDAHSKVRWAACQAVGQLCTDLGPDMQEAEHARLLPGLMSVMDDFTQPRVQAHAAAAVVNFSENCEQVLPPALVLITLFPFICNLGSRCQLLPHHRSSIMPFAWNTL